MDSRIAALLADFAEHAELDHLEDLARRQLTEFFGCDAAYFATIGPRFTESCPPYFREILAAPQRYDPGQHKAIEIASRFGPAFIDTEAYSPAERDRSLIARELLRPAGISSTVLVAVHLAGRTTGLIHLARSGRPFRQETLDAAAPLLRAISILHHALVGLPVPMLTPVHEGEAPPDVVARLTAREREVAAIAADGCGALQIAARLGTSVHTVRRQIESIYRKCEVNNRVELSMLVAQVQTRRIAMGVSADARMRDGFHRIVRSVNLRPAVCAEDWEAFI